MLENIFIVCLKPPICWQNKLGSFVEYPNDEVWKDINVIAKLNKILCRYLSIQTNTQRDSKRTAHTAQQVT